MLIEPNSMGECIYFTNRTFDKGSIKAWVFKQPCPKCNKSLMSKPRDSKGKIKIRAKEYVCPTCNYTLPQEEYEDTLTINIKYTCPHCTFSGELQSPFKRKKAKLFDEEETKSKTVDAIVFKCQKCNKPINLVKKMKEV